MHQRVAVDAFDGGGGRQRRIAFDPEKSGTVENEIGTEALTPARTAWRKASASLRGVPAASCFVRMSER